MRLMTSLVALATTLSAFADQDFCKKELDRNNPAAILAAMDYDLNQIENGGQPCGSFTDYFAINGWYAIKAGASRTSVNRRVDRLVALAERKVYLSGFEADLAKDGGTAAIREYMNGMIKDGIADLTKDATHVPEDVQAQLAVMKAGKTVKCGGTFGCGTGVYRLTEGHEIPFYWYSFSNSHGWEQLALTAQVYGYDLRNIRALRDQLGRRGIYDAWSSANITWIGLSNDLWVSDDVQNKYMHVKKWVDLPGGSKKGEYEYRHAELKRDYLDRLTAATGGHLRFNVIE